RRHQPGAAAGRQRPGQATDGERAVVSTDVESPAVGVGRARRLATGRPPRPRRVTDGLDDRLLLVGGYVPLTTLLRVVLLPLVYIVASSLSAPLAVSSGRVSFWPVDFTLEGYRRVLSDPSILTGFGNSIFYTLVGTAISLVLTV